MKSAGKSCSSCEFKSNCPNASMDLSSELSPSCNSNVSKSNRSSQKQTCK